MSKVLVILSGGLDSTTCLYWALSKYKKVGAVSFRYGSKHNKMELSKASQICKNLDVPHRIIDIPLLGVVKSNLMSDGGDIPQAHYNKENIETTVVPFRNGIFLAIAAAFAESEGYESIILGNHSGDHEIYKDCRPEFIDKMSAAIKLGTNHEVTLISPFCMNTKSEIVETGYKLGVDFSQTYSCYNGRASGHCGKCATCLERKEAFIEAGVNDPTDYE